jgi:polysaccharide export outer membrane protein
MKRPLLLICCLLVLGSCVQNRKYLYLQKNDLHRDGPVQDSVAVREYDLTQFEYKIQSMDNLSIRFESLSPEEFDFLSKQTGQTMMANPATAFLYGELVDDDGFITYPVIGKVHVAGLTIFEAQDKLHQLALGFLESPKVQVRLYNFRVTVLGEVLHEGVVPVNNNRVTLIEVIGSVGGLGELADRANIKVIRQHAGHAKVYYIDLLDEKFMTSPLYYVHQGDIIVVPPLKQRAFRKYFGPNLALIVSSMTLLLLAYNIVK